MTDIGGEKTNCKLCKKETNKPHTIKVMGGIKETYCPDCWVRYKHLILSK